MRKRTGTAARAVLLLGLGILGAAGCAQQPGGTTAPDPALPSPFDGVLHYGVRDRQSLHATEERLVADCMRRRGQAYAPQPLATRAADPEDINPYGLLTDARARTDGYGITSARLSARPVADPNRDHAREPRWNQALLGTESHRVRLRLPGGIEFFYNSDACVTQARQSLYGADYDRLSNTFQVLSDQVITAVRKDPDYLRAQERWARCMAAAGTGAKSLDDARDLVGKRLDQALEQPLEQAGSPSASDRLRDVAGYELKVSGQDAACQRTAGLARTVAEAQARAEPVVPGFRAADLRRLRELRSAAVRRAATV